MKNHDKKTRQDCSNIPEPSPIEVRRYICKWDKSDEHKKPEEALLKLFKNFPKNTELAEVLIKIYTLDNAYNTNILAPHFVTISKRIANSTIDTDLEKNNLGIIEHIRTTPDIHNYYSFATKYCSFHNPESFPMYDSRIVQMLTCFKRKSKFSDFTQADLRDDYKKFRDVVSDFRKFYKLVSFSFRDIDKYLFLAYEDVFLLERRGK